LPLLLQLPLVQLPLLLQVPLLLPLLFCLSSFAEGGGPAVRL
jgi:hypothetical protein